MLQDYEAFLKARNGKASPYPVLRKMGSLVLPVSGRIYNGEAERGTKEKSARSSFPEHGGLAGQASGQRPSSI
jgi:hypothetical protein